MKRILLIVLSGFYFVASHGQTAGIPSNVTPNQALRTATAKQTGGTLPVLKLIPVTTSGKYVFGQGQYLSNDGLMNGFMRVMPDGTYGLAIDGSLISGGGGASTTNLSLGVGTATSQPIANSNGTGVTLTGATTGTAGLLIGTDKSKLDLIAVTSAVNLNNLLLKNSLITAGTKTKITYDANGLVTSATDATASDILNIASGTIAATNVQSAITELNNEKVNLSDYTGKGTILSASATAGQPVGTSVGSDGQVLVANSGTTSGLSWATLPAATAVQFQNQGTNVGTAGQANTYNFTGSGVTTAVAGATATVTINSSSILNYSAGNGATVVATGAGATFTRTTASVWTFAIPSGVRLLSFNIYSTNGENMGATSTLVFDYTGNTLTNQGATTAEPPTLTVYQDGGGGMNQLVVGGSATSAFRPAISAVGSGDITLLSQSGSIASTGATIIKGQF